MSDLQKYNRPELTEEKSKVLKAYQGMPVKDSNDAELANIIQVLIQETALSVGHKNTFQDAQQVGLVVKDILASVKIEHKGLRLDEIKLAFSLGRGGRFGEYANLNAKVFCNWLRQYKKEVREPAMLGYSEEKPKTQEEIDQLNAEANERLKNDFLKIYNESLQQGENLFTDIIQNKRFYGLLSDANIIEYNDPRKNKIYQETAERMATQWKIAGKSRIVLKDFLEKGVGPIQNSVVSECRSKFFFLVVQECLDNLEDLSERL